MPGPIIAAAATAAAYTVASVGVEMGIAALTKQPEPDGQIKPFSQSRPERCVLMGNASRMSAALISGAQ